MTIENDGIIEILSYGTGRRLLFSRDNNLDGEVEYFRSITEENRINVCQK
jgi:hypothetical protein